MMKSAIKILVFGVLQFAVSAPSLAGNCLHPSNWKDDKCINDDEIPCYAGFYNMVTEGHGYGLGKLTYEELVNFFCRLCEIGYYCPGDNHRYECENAEKKAMDKCPDVSENLKKHIDLLKNQQQLFRPF